MMNQQSIAGSHQGMRRFFLLFASCFFMLADFIFAAGVGTTSANFLKIGIGARAIGMGEAYSGVVDDATALYWNPAGLVHVKQKEVSFSHMEYLDEIRYEWLGYAHPVSVQPTSRSSMRVQLLDNFDDGSDPTTLGTPLGTWSDKDAGGASQITTAYYNEVQDNVYGPSGYSYQMTYLVERQPDGKSGYCGLWMSMGGRNVSIKDYFVFVVKGEKGGEKFEVGVKDQSGKEFKVPITNYLQVTNEWQTAIVPLTDFVGVDLTKVDNVNFTFSSDQGTIYVDNVGFGGSRRSRSAFGFAAGYLQTGDVDKYVETASPPFFERQGSFSAGDMTFTASYAQEVVLKSVQLPVGLSAKFLREALDSESFEALAFDLGILQTIPFDNVMVPIGLVVQNVGFVSEADQSADPLPVNIRVNASFRFVRQRFIFASDYSLPVDGVLRVNLGAEYWLGPVALRTGYIFGQDLGAMASVRAGIGVKFSRFSVDYAYAPFGDLGDVQRASVAYYFGEPVK